MTSASWMTKYGRRRVRHEPPTLDEALSAAECMTNDPGELVKLAAELMQMPVDDVRADAERILKARNGRTQIQVMTSRRTPAAVVVERKPARRVLSMMPIKSGSQRVI